VARSWRIGSGGRRMGGSLRHLRAFCTGAPRVPAGLRCGEGCGGRRVGVGAMTRSAWSWRSASCSCGMFGGAVTASPVLAGGGAAGRWRGSGGDPRDGGSDEGNPDAPAAAAL